MYYVLCLKLLTFPLSLGILDKNSLKPRQKLFKFMKSSSQDHKYKKTTTRKKYFMFTKKAYVKWRQKSVTEIVIMLAKTYEQCLY